MSTPAFDPNDRVMVHNYDDTKNTVQFGSEPAANIDGTEGTVIGVANIDGASTTHYKVVLDHDPYGLNLPYWLFTAAELRYIPNPKEN